jgi:predicted nucleic acid-binding protein
MTIVDTTVWVDYFHAVLNPETEWLDRNSGSVDIGLVDLSLCEVLQGFGDEAEFRIVRAELLYFPVVSTGGADFSLESA